MNCRACPASRRIDGVASSESSAHVDRRIEHRVTGAEARTDRRSLTTPLSTPMEAASQSGRGDATRLEGKEAATDKRWGNPVQRNCAMTSRTNRNSEGKNQRGGAPLSPAARQQRRQEAMKRYLAGEPIEVICREMGCSKSWLYNPIGCRSTLDGRGPARRKPRRLSKWKSYGCTRRCRQTDRVRSARM